MSRCIARRTGSAIQNAHRPFRNYVLSELQAMATQEAAQFNSASGREAAVTVDKVEALEDGSGKVEKP